MRSKVGPRWVLDVRYQLYTKSQVSARSQVGARYQLGTRYQINMRQRYTKGTKHEWQVEMRFKLPEWQVWSMKKVYARDLGNLQKCMCEGLVQGPWYIDLIQGVSIPVTQLIWLSVVVKRKMGWSQHVMFIMFQLWLLDLAIHGCLLLINGNYLNYYYDY